MIPGCLMRHRSCLAAALMAAFGVSSLAAHGGSYRGPGTPMTPSPAGPGFGGGMPGGNPGPSTGGMSAPSSDPTSWQFWWEHNKDPFLRLKDAIHALGNVTFSDEYFMGNSPVAVEPSLAPSLAERRDLVLPALAKLLGKTSNRDVQTAVMVAMAKIGVDGPGVEILPIFLRRLRRGDQEVRETAALCLGISQRIDALPELYALALDQHAGRRLLDRSAVDHRTRAYATYGLGLVAWGNDEITIKRDVHQVLAQLLADPSIKSRDLRVAAVKSIGLLNLDTRNSGQKRLLWKALDSLWEYYGRKLTKGEQVIQAHVPAAIARLLGRGASPEHERFKRLLAEELAGKGRGSVKRHNSRYQSAALALGQLALPREKRPADAVYGDCLLRYFQHGKDQLARYFSLIALAQIGGDTHRGQLLKVNVQAKRTNDRAWSALALGVLAFGQRADSGLIDETVGRTLLAKLRSIDNEDVRAATAVALGLCGYQDAASDMLKLLRKYRRREMGGGYLCIGLALMPAPDAVDVVRDVVAGAVRYPLLLTQAAIALAKLGDKTAISQLNALLKAGSQSVGRLSGVATAYRFIGDRRAIGPLIKLLGDDDLAKLSRAFVAAALGGVADKEQLPWNHKLAVGTNYRAVVDSLTNGQTGVLDIL